MQWRELMSACTCDLCAANRALWENPPSTPTRYDAASSLDEDTLRRSRQSMRSASASYRRNADQPREPWQDEIGVATGDYREAS